MSQLLDASGTPSDHSADGSSESCSVDSSTPYNVISTPPDAHQYRGEGANQWDLASNRRSSRTGLDGPLSVNRSSDTESSHWSIAVTSSSGSDIKYPESPPRLNLNQSATINWAKCLPRRKRRRQHDITEVSRAGHLSHRVSGILFKTGQETPDNSGGLARNDRLSRFKTEKSAANRHEKTAESCPELYGLADEFIGTALSTISTAGAHSRPRVSTTISFEQNEDRPYLASPKHRQPHLKVRDFRTLRFLSQLYLGMSPYTRRSKLPARLIGKERRILSRDSVDICPSSGDETPVYNTPNPAHIPYQRNHHTGNCPESLAMTSVVLAVGGLGQLSSRARRRGCLSEFPTTRFGHKRRRASHLSDLNMFPRLV